MSMDNELRIAVVDDLEQDRVQVAENTEAILDSAKITYSIDRYADAKALLSAIRSGKKYTLLLLDVLMDEMDGMALAGELRDQGNNTAIVFISSSQEMARRGYRVNAARYLIKPVDREELKKALLLKSTFILCHRAYIVNLALTKNIRQYEFIMKSGAAVPISRYRYNDVNQAFVDFVTD